MTMSAGQGFIQLFRDLTIEACHEKSGPGQNLVRGDQLLLQISVPVAKIGPRARVHYMVHVRSWTRKTL